MNRCLIAFALFALVFSSGASALIVEAPGNIVLLGEEKQITVSITNDSPLEEEFGLEFLGPVDATFSQNSGKIAAFKTKEVQMSIAPDKALEGQTYESTLVVETESEKITRKITLLFKEAAEEENGEEEPSNGIPSGLFALPSFGSILTLENALNAVLAVVAAVLLIAFIARLVKRLEARK